MKRTKERQRIMAWTLLMVMLLLVLSAVLKEESYLAASSYTNAKEFYETASTDRPYRAEAYDGRFYFATSAKLAASRELERAGRLTYSSVAFDVSLTGNGHSVSFTIQKGGEFITTVDTQYEYKNGSTYDYVLYAIETQTLYELAKKANAAEAAYVLDASIIKVRMDAIIITRSGGEPSGGVTCNSNGGFTSWGTIYRMKNDADWTALTRKFSGHTFESYRNISDDLKNYLLTIRYAANGTPELSANSSSVVTVDNGYRLVSSTMNGVTTPYVLYKGKIHTTTCRTMNMLTLLDPLDKEGANLKKTGYRLEKGKEWMTAEGAVFSANKLYGPKDISATGGIQDTNMYVYANWLPNTYNIIYDANGGTGSMLKTPATYDKDVTLRANAFRRAGYTFKGWATTTTGEVSYVNGDMVSNLTTEHEGNVTLYAVWEPVTPLITLNPQEGSGGTEYFYEKFGVNFYTSRLFTTVISQISLPDRLGYDFKGYFEDKAGIGTALIDEAGTITAPNTKFFADTTLFAKWVAKTFTIVFDKQGGTKGSNFATATYNQLLPTAGTDRLEPPVKGEFTFKGYFTGTNGTGIRYYDEFMYSDITYSTAADTMLYAYWIDEAPPTIHLLGGNGDWSNQQITLSAIAADYGTGLSSVSIYRIESDGSLIAVAAATGLNGATTKTVTFDNTTEGVTRYKAVATDMEGNVSESYNTVYYDTTAPTGDLIQFSQNGTIIYINVNVTDIDTGN